MRAIRFRLTLELLVQALQLPEGTELINLYEIDRHINKIALMAIVRNDDFPEAAEMDRTRRWR